MPSLIGMARHTPEAILRPNSVILGSYALGRHYTTCPRCWRPLNAREPQGEMPRCHHRRRRQGPSWLQQLQLDRPREGEPAGNGNGGEGTPLVAYVYGDPAGAPLFRKVRNAPGREPRFWLQKPDGNGGWVKGTKGVDTSILYHADEAAKAIAGGSVILVAEGEKDVDRLRALGFAPLATPTARARRARNPSGRRPTASNCAAPTSSCSTITTRPVTPTPTPRASSRSASASASSASTSRMHGQTYPRVATFRIGLTKATRARSLRR